MVNMVVELENNNSYLILDETCLKDNKYYFGLRLDENDEPTNNYLFFGEFKEGSDVFLVPIEDNEFREILLTSFTINFLDKVYDEI